MALKVRRGDGITGRQRCLDLGRVAVRTAASACLHGECYIGSVQAPDSLLTGRRSSASSVWRFVGSSRSRACSADRTSRVSRASATSFSITAIFIRATICARSTGAPICVWNGCSSRCSAPSRGRRCAFCSTPASRWPAGRRAGGRGQVHLRLPAGGGAVLCGSGAARDDRDPALRREAGRKLPGAGRTPPLCHGCGFHRRPLDRAADRISTTRCASFSRAPARGCGRSSLGFSR